MSAKRPFRTTAVVHPDGEVEFMGGSLRAVREYLMDNHPKARAVVVREVMPDDGAEVRDLKARIRRAWRYIGSVSTGSFVQGSLVLAAHRALDLRRPLKRGRR